MKRTISLKLDLSHEHSQALELLQHEFAAGCNEAVALASQNTCKNRVSLHHIAYYPIRQKLPLLGAQMTCNAIAKVTNSYAALLKRRKDAFPTIVFRKNTSVHFDKRTYSIKGDTISLYTLSKRIRVKFRIGPFQKEYLSRGSIREAELIRKGKNWFFQLVLELPDVSSKQAE